MFQDSIIPYLYTLKFQYNSIINNLRWSLEAIFFILLSLPIAVLPTRVALKTGKILGILLFYILSNRKKIAVENIRNAVIYSALNTTESPDVIAKKSYISLGMSLVEIIKIYYGLGEKIIDAVEIKGIENYRKAISKEKGVIFITGHCGNWELMSLTLSSKVENGSVVARAQNNPYLNRLIERIRSRYGNRVIYKEGALKNILTELKNKRAVGILMDQAVIENEGYIIEFLGRGAWTMKIPAVIARRTGASVLPAFIHRNNRGHVINIMPVIEMSKKEDKRDAEIEDTKRCTHFIENYIKEYPTEWLWMHRRWKRVEV